MAIIGLFGNKVNDTPPIKGMMGKSMFYTPFYSANLLCSPSCATIIPKHINQATGSCGDAVFPKDTYKLTPV